MNDHEFIRRFESDEPDDLAHRDHIRVAFAYARRGGVAGAIEGARGIRRFAEARGAFGKYHDTMTVAWARVVGRLAVDSAPLPFAEFLDAHPELMRRDLLSAHYSKGLLLSERARAAFVEPDLAPLPAA